MEFFTALIDWISANPVEAALAVTGIISTIYTWFYRRSLRASNKSLHDKMDNLEIQHKLSVQEIKKSSEKSSEEANLLKYLISDLTNHFPEHQQEIIEKAKAKGISLHISTGRPEVSVSVGVVKPEKKSQK